MDNVQRSIAKRRSPDLETRYDTARQEKLIAEAEIKQHQAKIEELKKQKMAGSLISLADTQAAFSELGSRTKAHFSRLASELPPKLEGLAAQAMIAVIQTQLETIFEQLYSELAAAPPPVIDEEPAPLLKEESLL